MFEFSKSSVSLTAKRALYEEGIMAGIVNKVASDLIAGETVREVGIEVLARIVKARNPMVKAADVDSEVAKAVDNRIEELKAMTQPQGTEAENLPHGEGNEGGESGEVTSDGQVGDNGEQGNPEVNPTEEETQGKGKTRKSAA